MKEKWKNDKKIRRNCVLAGIALAILLGASVYTLFIQPNLSTETYVYKEETVVRGNLVLGIMESGSLSLGESSVMYELDLELEDEEVPLADAAALAQSASHGVSHIIEIVTTGVLSVFFAGSTRKQKKEVSELKKELDDKERR